MTIVATVAGELGETPIITISQAHELAGKGKPSTIVTLSWSYLPDFNLTILQMSYPVGVMGLTSKRHQIVSAGELVKNIVSLQSEVILWLSEEGFDEKEVARIFS